MLFPCVVHCLFKAIRWTKNQQQINPKSIKIVPGSTPKTILEIGRRQDERPTKFWEQFGRHLVDFGRFWGALQIQGGAKNGPTNSVRRLLGVQKRPKGANKWFLEGFENILDFSLILSRGNYAFEEE